MDRHDRENRHHRNDKRGDTDRYSLQELKERARESLKHRSGNRDYDRRDNRHDRHRERSRSRERRPNNNTEHMRSSSPPPPRHNHQSSSSRPDFLYNEREKSHRGSGSREPRKFDHHSRNKNNFNDDYRRNNNGGDNGDDKPKEEEEVKADIKPNFELTGTLAQDTNLFNGVVVKYNEPAEAKKPRKQWRLYPFKGDTALEFIPVHRQSAYLFGRDRKVADIAIDHPSCSKQHAVLQYRSIEFERDDGTKGRRTCPYIIDLESANGTFINYKKADPKRYVELMERDVIKFGFSTREYVLLHEQSQNEEEENDEEAV